MRRRSLPSSLHSPSRGDEIPHVNHHSGLTIANAIGANATQSLAPPIFLTLSLISGPFPSRRVVPVPAVSSIRSISLPPFHRSVSPVLTFAMTFQRSPDLVTTSISDDELVLLHLQTHRYYSLNTTGRFIWAGLVEGKTPEQIVDAALERWEAERGEVETYVYDLIEELKSERLLIPQRDAT